MIDINYTIIIPHKNISNLLRRCLASIPRREDIQIIVVDDNSDPEKVDFNHFPGMGEPYVEVYFTKEGKGAGYARNVGLKYANGKWLIFMDADDFLLPEAFEIFDSYLESSCDIVYFMIDSCYSDSLLPAKRHLIKEEKIANIISDSKELDLYLRYGYTEPWGKMIKKDLVLSNNILFDETLCANDYMFSVLSGFYASKVMLVNEKAICITVREGSLCNCYFDSKDKALSRFYVYESVQKFFVEHDIKLRPFFALISYSYRKDRRIFKLYMHECNIRKYNLINLFVNSMFVSIVSRLKSKKRFSLPIVIG